MIRSPEARVSLLPNFAYFDRFLQIVRDRPVIDQRDIQLFVFAGALAQLVGFARRRDRFVVKTAVELLTRQGLITQRERRVEFDRALIKRNGVRIIAAVGLL